MDFRALIYMQVELTCDQGSLTTPSGRTWNGKHDNLQQFLNYIKNNFSIENWSGWLIIQKIDFGTSKAIDLTKAFESVVILPIASLDEDKSIVCIVSVEDWSSKPSPSATGVGCQGTLTTQANSTFSVQKTKELNKITQKRLLFLRYRSASPSWCPSLCSSLVWLR